jgi:hypothetical protein
MSKYQDARPDLGWRDQQIRELSKAFADGRLSWEVYEVELNRIQGRVTPVAASAAAGTGHTPGSDMPQPIGEIDLAMPSAGKPVVTDTALHERIAALEEELDKLRSRPAEAARAWRSRQPDKGHRTPHFGRPAYRPLHAAERASIMRRAYTIERTTRRPGCANGALGDKGLRLIRTLLYVECTWRTGECCPALATVAAHAGMSVSCAQDCIKRAEAAGVLVVCRRLKMDRTKDGRRIALRDTNGYVFRQMPTGRPDTEFRQESGDKIYRKIGNATSVCPSLGSALHQGPASG